MAFQHRLNARSTDVFTSGLSGYLDGKNQSGLNPSLPCSQEK